MRSLKQSHSAKRKRWEPLGFFIIPLVAENQNNRSEDSLTASKNGKKSHNAKKPEKPKLLSWENGVPFCFGMVFYFILVAMDEFKMSVQKQVQRAYDETAPLLGFFWDECRISLNSN